MTTETSVDLTAWVGRVETRTGHVPAGLEGELRGILDLPGRADGEDLLPGLHWLIFDHFAPATGTGSDGHARRGGFLPPVPAPRRMWAGGRIEFVAPLTAGIQLTRRSEVHSVVTKAGKTGPLVFVTVTHEIAGPGGVVIREKQDLVYMGIKPAPPRQKRAPAPQVHASTTVIPDEVMLFRYSALTHNSHRIHYDADYATTTELYPALVVHGPLTATLLMWFATQVIGEGGHIASFVFRGLSPLYVHDRIRLEADPVDDGFALVARTPTGETGMSATAVVAR